MTRKHFKALAEALFDAKPDSTLHIPAYIIQWKIDVNYVAEVCRRFNPQFDRGRFLKACGYD